MPRSARYPDRLLPSKELRAVWKARGEQLLGDKDYDGRWLRFWKATLDRCRDQGTWSDSDLSALEEYVEWRRLAEDHRREAESDPYQTHSESGRVYAHPGFDKARDARREAREVARQLCITPDTRPDDGGGDGAPDDQADL